MFGQRSYIRYGNGAETRYSYSTNRQRLSTLAVKTKETEVMNNTYKYDVMDNIVGLIGQGKPQTLQDGKSIGGAITHTYSYDEWDRLIGAKGTFNGGGSKTATYDLRMEYDKLYNITSKQLDLKQNNLQFAGTLQTGYSHTYNYKENDPFRLESIDTKQYSKDGEAEADTIFRVNSYDFDDNGNLTLQLVDTQRDSAHVADTMGTKVKNHLWDEENRLLAINDNGFVSNYFYDASGERTVKLSKPDLYVYVNSAEKLKGDTLPVKFVGYVSPYLVVTNGGRYTKHIYAGSQRIASKLGDIEAFGADPRRVAKAGHDVDNAEPIDFSEKYSKQNSSLSVRYDSLKVKTKPKENNDYVNGKSFCCSDKNLDEIEQNETNSAENAKLEDNLYFYHPDHLGSTNLITNFDGEVTQSVAYVPYGEVFVEERNGSWVTPFLFNAKELDEETGLYYYGARYLDPVDARWLSPDPMQGKYPGMSPYNYCSANPIKLIDPDGRENTIYVVDLQDKKKKDINTEELIKTTNDRLNDFSFNTKCVLAPDGKNFDPSKLDKTDSYVVIGDVNNVRQFIEKNNPEAFSSDYNNKDDVWRGGSGNPERSVNKGNLIAIDALGAKKAAGDFKSNPEDFASFLILHGAGHNAGMNHSDGMKKGFSANTAIIMGSGRLIQKCFYEFKTINNINQTMNGVWNNNDYHNDYYFEKFIEHFGNKKSKANYIPSKK